LVFKEERNYWEAPRNYNMMSPFANAEKVDEPISLVQWSSRHNRRIRCKSERYFNALKGLGATQTGDVALMKANTAMRPRNRFYMYCVGTRSVVR
jgi:hypothetical protein